jgi:tetratricopeptide (TPR) repeat protein
MGGIGKTTVAAAVAEANRHKLDVVWWVRAEEEATIIADLSELAPFVGLALSDAGIAEIARRVRRWFEQTDRNWLLVFDNALSEESLEPWRPKRGVGMVLITSRSRNFDRIGSVIELGVLEPEAAEHFLRLRVQARNPAAAAEPEARTVAERLDGLPLALEQAGSWVARAPTRQFSRYLELLDDASKEPFPDGTRPLGYDATAVTTWRVSIEAAAVDAPLAAKLMQVLGFFAPHPLPLEWLVDKAVVQDPLLNCTADQVTDALVALHDYSLAQLGSDTLRIHRVIQQAARRTSDTGAALLAIRIARTQLDAFDGRPSDTQSSVAQPIGVHVAALSSHIHKSFPDLVRHDEQFRGFLDAVVTWSDRQRILSRYFEALLPAASVFVIRREVDGLDQTGTLKAGRVAVAAMEGLGMLSEARALGNRLDEIDLARSDAEEPTPRPSSVLFGPDKIEALNSHAEQLLRDGKHDDALAVKLNILSSTGWYYGHHSQATGEVFMDLARFCVAMEKIEAAVRYASEGFELLQRHLDHDDPVFGLTLINLSGVQHAAGKPDEARKSIEEALRILTTRLVHPHSVVGSAYGQLSLILESTGDYEGASAASQKAFDTLVAVHGEEHPAVAQLLANWALVLQKLEKRHEAIAAAQRAVDLYQKAYSEDHWETRWARRILETVTQR